MICLYKRGNERYLLEVHAPHHKAELLGTAMAAALLLRYRKTKSFRHDIKNHLSVLGGLLRSGKLEEGREYLKKLEAVSEALSFPCQTGNPVVDILLGEKPGVAKDLAAEVSLVRPKPCGIDDVDLCVLFANALDDAITACRIGGEAKAIRISGKRVSLCPMKNLPLKDKTAVPGGKWTMGCRCVSFCPTQAITRLGKRVYEQCHIDIKQILLRSDRYRRQDESHQSKMNISSIGASTALEMSTANFREGLYCAFSSRMMVSRRTPTCAASCSWVKSFRCRYFFNLHSNSAIPYSPASSV